MLVQVNTTLTEEEICKKPQSAESALWVSESIIFTHRRREDLVLLLGYGKPG